MLGDETPYKQRRDQESSLIDGFLEDRKDWHAALEWEQVALSSREGTRRTVRVLVIGAILVALGLLLVRLLT